MEAFRNSFQRLRAPNQEDVEDKALERETSDDAEEYTEPRKDQTMISQSEGKQVSTNPFDGPATPEPPQYQVQSRDHEKTPPGIDGNPASPESANRTDPPSSSQERKFFRTLFTDATDAWLSKHADTAEQPPVTANEPTSAHKKKKSSQKKTKAQREPEEIICAEEAIASADNKAREGQPDPSEELHCGYLPKESLVDPPEISMEDPPEEEILVEDESIVSMAETEEQKEVTIVENDKHQDNGSCMSTQSFSYNNESSTQASDDSDRPRELTSWANFISLSQTSPTGFPMYEMDSVYVHDPFYSWIPAKVLEYHPDCALVAIDPPEAWEATTTLPRKSQPSNGPVHQSMNDVAAEDIERLVEIYGIPKSQLRKATNTDYERGVLPGQNHGESKRDMADLPELNQAAILYNLKERHAQGKPYTRVGDIVVAMNPFAWINHLYKPSTRDLYSTKLIWEAQEESEIVVSELSEQKGRYDRLGFEPHVYEVSALAYKGLATTGQDQTIIVTGESGAGKTETVKIVLNHLATVQQTRPGGVPTEHSPAKDVVSRVLRSSPLFEAFGNAKTIRNHNSSRFGKFVQLQFQMEPKELAELGKRQVPFTDLVGCKCTTYLLEKNRVVHQDPGERNFHIFYQLLAAPTDFKEFIWPSLGKKTAEEFAYTAAEVGNKSIDGEAWEDTIVALELFRFEGKTLKALLQALVIVLQLGNLIFEENASEFEEHSTRIRNFQCLEELSQLMGISSFKIEDCLTSRVLKTPGHSDIKVKLSAQVAKESCDALAKEIFARVFGVLVRKINNYTSYPATLQEGSNSIGQICLLDIFGFESFSVNRFEQLCINYANERLHNRYVADNFNEVRLEYEAEEVDLYDFKLVDNSDVLSLLQGNPGIVASLNEECMLPSGNAESFVYKIKTTLNDSSRLVDKKLHQKHQFGVRHFTGTVEYNAEDFLERNIDKMPDGLLECVAKSHNSLLAAEFTEISPDLTEEDSVSSGHSNKRRSTSVGKKTVLYKFQKQLKGLLSAMEGSKTRYIRCIKPNPSMTASKTEHMSTIQQLNCSGLMTALTIARESFPNKLPYETVLKRYSTLLSEVENEEVRSASARDKVEYLLNKYLRNLSKRGRTGRAQLAFACGKTRVFFKAGAQDRLESLRMRHLEAAAISIQTMARKFVARKDFERTKLSVATIQHFSKMVLARAKFNAIRGAATRIACCFRVHQANRLLNKLQKERRAAICIQSCLRGFLKRDLYRKQYAAVVTVQKIGRSVHAKHVLKKRRATMEDEQRIAKETSRREQENAAVKIQAHMRSLPMKREFSRNKNSALVIQRASRSFGASVNPTKKEGLLKQQARTNEMLLSLSEELISGKKGNKAAEKETLIESLRYELSSLRSQCTELEAKLDVCDTERQELKKTSDTSNAAVETYRSRTRDLVKANDSLVKEVHRARQEAAKAKRRLQNSTEQTSASLATLKKEMVEIKETYEKDIKELRTALKESQKQRCDDQDGFKQASMVKAEKFDLEKRKLKEELKLVKKASMQKLSKVMDLLQTTHALREVEISKLEATIHSVEREKDNEIVALKHEVAALRNGKSGGSQNISVSLDATGLRSQLDKVSAASSRRSAQFDDCVQSFRTLVTESCALPSDVSESEIKTVMEEQERGQRMHDLIEVMNHLYRMEEDSQFKAHEKSMSLLEEYVTLREPQAAVIGMQRHLSQMKRENEQLQEELRQQYCERCAVRDSAGVVKR